jgi:chloramphenicol 3-O phosphotransferase
VGTDVIVLNGGSSSGKSSIARGLQTLLAELWLTLGIDTLLESMPLPASGHDPGITFAPTGDIAVDDSFRLLETAWYQGIATMVRAGARVIIDDVFLGGGESQARLQTALAGLEIFWVAVHCDPQVASAREVGRPLRIVGMAARQAETVHRGVRYDVEVDTTSISTMDCARAIVSHLAL